MYWMLSRICPLYRWMVEIYNNDCTDNSFITILLTEVIYMSHDSVNKQLKIKSFSN